MPKVRITENPAYTPGHVGRLLTLVAPKPVVINPDGSYTADLTDQQLESFYGRGGVAHKVEIVPTDSPYATAGTGPGAGPETETKTLTAVAPRTRRPEEEYVAQCRERGMKDSEIIQDLVKAGWKESQAIDLVANGDDGPAAA